MLSRAAISVVTTSAVSVALCYILGAHQHKRRRNGINEKPMKSNCTSTLKTCASDDDDPSFGQEHADDDCNDTPVLAISQMAEDKTVVLYAKGGAEIEGSISAKDDIVDADATVRFLCQVNDEMRLVTFSPKEAEDNAVPSSQSALLPPPQIRRLDVGTLTKKESRPGGDLATSRRLPMCDSEAVIMISSDDMAMVQQLLLDMQDDEELFDCGDEMMPSCAVAG